MVCSVNGLLQICLGVDEGSNEGGTALVEVSRGGALETLEYFHDLLDVHFRTLHTRRQALEMPAPVFALEHGLGSDDLKLLQDAVVAVHRERLLARAAKQSWLPLVVHAAEVGYIYDGVEFWPIYAESTPGWCDSAYERDRVRDLLEKFAEKYGGAIPQGAWAATFRKIAWPITHAVLPRYLQVQLARMLYDYRTGWPSLLHNPSALGVRLHAWSRQYGERFEKFCQNTALLGHVAVALLLSGEDDESPYIESTTLDRLVASLNSERESRRWLHDARRSASIVRMHNFRPSAGINKRGSHQQRLPTATDPKLQLKRVSGVVKAFAVLPDLKPLQRILPVVYDELRKSRASVAGAQQVIPTGGLLYATAPVELVSWPSATQPFLQLQRAANGVNLLLAEQCRITRGPWWVFRCKPGQPAIEIKGKFVRPSGHYYIVGAPDLSPPDVTWCEKVEIAVDGVCAYDLKVPSTLSKPDSKALAVAGISVVSDVAIRPVGFVASHWDGEGSVEWLAGEPALIAIHAQHSPSKVRLIINGEPYYVEWPEGKTDLFLSIDGLDVGTHEIVASVGDPDGDGHKTEGILIVSMRDPQVRTAGASLGEGIRLRTLPAQPSLPELWDGRAVIEIDGPEGTTADFRITLLNGAGAELASYKTSHRLPVTSDSWRPLISRMREHPQLAKHYDEADVANLSISRAGIGFATLSAERGFRGLRWVVSARHRDGGYAARLIDRTDRSPVSVEFFSVERPLIGVRQPADKEFIGPPRGGLLWATNGEEAAGQIVPPDPNEMLRLGPAKPSVSVAQKSLAEVHKLMHMHRKWQDADLPAHPFGMRERCRVLDALTTAMAVMLAPGGWAAFEQRIVGLAPAEINLDEAQELVGHSPPQRAAAQAIASQLWQWDTQKALVLGFSDAIDNLAVSAGISHKLQGARFLLQLATSPGELLDWEKSERNQYLRCVLVNPVLMRAARFAALGTADELAGGVG